MPSNYAEHVELTVVATCYNDASITPELVAEIEKQLAYLNGSWEIILVNDCSLDNTDEVIRELCRSNSRIKGISLSRNFGQQTAISVGIDYAKGKYVVIMDGDLQNPPEAIPRLHEEIEKGFDIVYAISKERNNFRDKTTSAVFWFLVSTIFRVDIVRNQLMMKIMTNECAARFCMYRENVRTVAGIVHDISINYSTVEVHNSKRLAGRSNYSFLKRFNLMIDLVMNLTTAPLNSMIYVGSISMLVSICFSLYLLFVYYFNDVTPGYTSVIMAIVFFGGLNVMLLGFIGRYLANIYTEVKRRPLYHIRKTYNVEK